MSQTVPEWHFSIYFRVFGGYPNAYEMFALCFLAFFF